MKPKRSLGIHKSLPLDPALIQLNPAHSVILLPIHDKAHKWSFQCKDNKYCTAAK